MVNRVLLFSIPPFNLIASLLLFVPVGSFGMAPDDISKLQTQIGWMQQVQGRAKSDDSPQSQKILKIIPDAIEFGRTITSKYNLSYFEVSDSLDHINGEVKGLQDKAKKIEGFKRYLRRKTDPEKEVYARRDELKKKMSGINKELDTLLKQFQKQVVIVQTYDQQAQKRGLKATLEHPHTQEFRNKCLRENIAGVEKPATGILGFLRRVFGKPAIGHLTKENSDGTLLISAIGNGKEDLVAAYIQQRGDLNVKAGSTFEKSPAAIALEQGNYKIARMLIDAGADLHETATTDGRRLLEVVTDLARPGVNYRRVANPEVVGDAEFHKLVMSIVSRTSTLDLVGASKGTSGESGENLGKDLLQWSLDGGHGDVAMELIRKGVDLSSPSYDEKYHDTHRLADGNLKLSPTEIEEAKKKILLSTLRENPSVVAFDTMIQLGAKVPSPGSDDFPLGDILHRAGVMNEPKLLAERKILLQLADRVLAGGKPEEWTRAPSLLMDTVALNSKEMLQAIYSKVGKAGVDFVDISGRSAIDNALQYRAWNSFDFLMEKGDTAKQVPSEDFTRLMTSVQKGDLETTQKLLPHLKSDPEQINRVVTQMIKNETHAVKWTAYDLALTNLKSLNANIITELEKAGAKGVPVESLEPYLAKIFREILELPAQGQLTRRQIGEAAKKIYDGLDHNDGYANVDPTKHPALAKAADVVNSRQFGQGVLGALNMANQELQRSVPGP